MDSMFYNCTSLTSIDISNFNIQTKTYISNMFHYCHSLIYINISNLVTDKNITRPTIKNIISTDLRAVEPVISSNDDLVSILVDDVDTEINVDYLLEKLSNKEWKVSTSDE